jgi:SAM-dependent methyltransferase
MTHTRDQEYAERLRRLQGRWWKRLLDVQAPYRWNMRRLKLGKTLEVGCGIGRNLTFLGSDGVGVDGNAFAVQIARDRGLQAYEVKDFAGSEFARPGSFDSLLLSHVVEHMTIDEAIETIGQYTEYLKPVSRLVLVSPQEKGFASDPTHVQFMDCTKLAEIQRRTGFAPDRCFSFPFPRSFGTAFTYNEFVSLGSRSGQQTS